AEFTRHLCHRAHGHAVSDVSTAKRGDAGERPDVHDAAVTSYKHAAPCFLTGAEAAEHEIAPATLHLFQRDGFRRSTDSVTRAVTEEVDGAKLRVETVE